LIDEFTKDLTAAAAELKDIEAKIADANRQINLLTATDIDGTTQKGKRDLVKLDKFNLDLNSYSLKLISA